MQVHTGIKKKKVMLSSELGKWNVGKLTKTKCLCLFSRIMYLTLEIFSEFVSREFGRAIEAQEPGRHYLLLIFTFWRSLTSAGRNVHHRHSSNIRGVRCYKGALLAHNCCLPTSDQGPAFHCAGHGTRLHGLRLSGRSPLQYLKWTERFAPSWRGWMQRTVRIW